MARPQRISTRFSISYEIAKTNCDDTPSNPDNSDYEGFMLNAVYGEAVLRCGDRSISTGRCALLWLSRSLINLCTFPVLYRMEAYETVMETSMGLRSRFHEGKIVLAVYMKRKPQFAFEIPLDEALQAVGAFHRSLLTELFERCPSLRSNDHLLVRIPYGFAIKHINHFKGLSDRLEEMGRRSSDSHGRSGGP